MESAPAAPDGIESRMAEYTKMLANELRGVCRQMRVTPETLTKKGYLEALRIGLETEQILESSGAVHGPTKKNPQSQRKIDTSCRLLNVMFSDQFYARFSELGDPSTRYQLDTRSIGAFSPYFTEIVQAYNDEDQEEFNHLHNIDPLFASVDPANFKQLDAEKLWAVWKDLSSAYRAAHTRFTTSGNHRPFVHYHGGRIDVYYFHLLVTITRRDLLSCVTHTLPEEIAFDSINSTPKNKFPNESTRINSTAKKGEAVADAIRELVAYRETTNMNSTKNTKRQLDYAEEQLELKRLKNEREKEIHGPTMNTAKIKERAARVEFMLTLQRNISELRVQISALKAHANAKEAADELYELEQCLAAVQKERASCML